MPATNFILFLHGPAWQMAHVTGEEPTFVELPAMEGAPPGEIAKRVAEDLRRLGYQGDGVLLALASEQCLAAPLDIHDLPRGDRKAMLYRLEEKLPIAAEHIVADFAQGTGRALGVATRSDALGPLVRALEANGVAVQSICPEALLAAQALADSYGCRVVVLGEGDRVNVISVDNELPATWALLPAQPVEVRLHLDFLSLQEEPGPMVACGVDSSITGSAAVEQEAGSARQVAAIGGANILDGHRPWVEFRRGPLAISDPIRLHRKPLNALLAAAAMFLICLTGGLFWRAHRYERATSAAERQMADEFAGAFPGWHPQGNLKEIVASEHRKLLGRGGSALPAVASESALRTMFAVLSKLPADLHFQVQHMTFNDTVVEVEAKLPKYEDIDVMASAARKAGLDVPPPQARRDADGFWSATLHGTKAVKPSPVARQVD